jgi:hypothetical protein
MREVDDPASPASAADNGDWARRWRALPAAGEPLHQRSAHDAHRAGSDPVSNRSEPPAAQNSQLLRVGKLLSMDQKISLTDAASEQSRDLFDGQQRVVARDFNARATRDHQFESRLPTGFFWLRSK